MLNPSILMIFISFSYTKMGYAGALEPQHIIPSAIGVRGGAKVGQSVHRGCDDLDFFIGDEAFANKNYDVKVIFRSI